MLAVTTVKCGMPLLSGGSLTGRCAAVVDTSRGTQPRAVIRVGGILAFSKLPSLDRFDGDLGPVREICIHGDHSSLAIRLSVHVDGRSRAGRAGADQNSE